MVELKPHHYKEGDAMPTYWADREGNLIPECWTVLEILDFPDSEEEVGTLVNNIITKYHSRGQTNVTLISVNNLAHKSDLIPFVELDKIYVMEA